ncbi:MAG: hypothetical protein ACAI44_14360 [Candidatus Sericytochromatia bacterium]
MSQMYAMVLPLLPGKFEDWKQFTQLLLNEKRKEYEASRLKAGIHREMMWHQPTPMGDMLILLVEAEGDFKDVMEAMSNPQDEFGEFFLAQAKVFHGLEPDNLKGVGANELVFNWSSPTLLEKAGETAMGIGQNLASSAQDVLGKASQTATGLGQNVASNATALAGKAQGMAQETTQRIQQQAQETGELLQKQAQEVKKNVEIKAAELMDKAGDSVAEATQQVQAKAGEVFESAAEVGQDLAEKASGLFHHALDMLHKKTAGHGDKDDDSKDPASKPEGQTESKAESKTD